MDPNSVHQKLVGLAHEATQNQNTFYADNQALDQKINKRRRGGRPSRYRRRFDVATGRDESVERSNSNSNEHEGNSNATDTHSRPATGAGQQAEQA